MEPTIFSIVLMILCLAISFVITYLVIKAAVRAGIKEAFGDLSTYLRQIVAAAIADAKNDSEKEQK